MKIKIITLTATFLLASLAFTHAGETPQTKPAPASSEFGRMKSLVGTWKGMADMGQGPVEMVQQFRLIAGGSVLEEKVFVGTPNEMATTKFAFEAACGINVKKESHMNSLRLTP